MPRLPHIQDLKMATETMQWFQNEQPTTSEQLENYRESELAVNTGNNGIFPAVTVLSAAILLVSSQNQPGARRTTVGELGQAKH